MSKSYGLGWTRIGWMVTPDPKTAMRLRRARRLIAGAGSAFGGAVAAWALKERPRFVERAKSIVAENYRSLDAWAASTPGVTLVRPDGGSVCFPQVTLPPGTTGVQFALQLLKTHGLFTTPGEVFGRPGHFRVGCASDPAQTAEALELFGAALANRPKSKGSKR